MNESSRTPNERELEIFYAAMEKTDPFERAAFLDAECADDPGLRLWVEAELRKQTSTTYIEAQTALGLTPTSGEPSISPEVEALLAALKPEEPGEWIGPYKLIQQLGEGGFGTVWMAEQARPVRREVALKILKPGMDSRQIIGRFEQERQALAMLDHPGIAKVFDAGATPTGRPFFAMELVRGKPITEFCNERWLPVRQRLELFMRVCYAVQHAHQKGIIHRDLKPSNILVSDHEGISIPKVIDLGLAKATLEIESERTLVVTQAERMIGTPLYMSPEQAEGSSDIDTRTDIYALGVVLYELLTGRTPHDPTEMAHRSHEQIRQAIREQDPQKPSSALRSMNGGVLSTIARLSGTEPTSLVRTVRGELDSICMKALEKDRRRRYLSAASFAADLQAHLLNEPISARPPSQWYRAKKFVVRNRRTVLAALMLVAVILIGAAVSVREALRAKAAEQNALFAREREVEQRTQAERERALARLNEYVADVNLAQQSLNSGNLGRAVQLLEKHRTKPSDPGQQGWAWRYLWNLAQGDEHIAFPDLSGPGNSVVFSTTGEFFAIGGRQNVTVYDARSRSVVATLPAGAESLAFLSDGKTLATTDGRRLRLWNTQNWVEHAELPEVSPGVKVFSSDGLQFASASREGVTIYDTLTQKVTRTIPGVRPPMMFAPGGHIFAADSNAGITIWSLDDAAKQAQVLTNSADLFGPTGNVFFRASQPIGFAAGGDVLIAVQNIPTENGIFLLRTWDVHSGREIAALPGDPEHTEHAGAITAVSISPDGRTFATTSLDHSVRLWDWEKRRRVSVLAGHRGEVGTASFSPDGRTLITCDRLGQVKAWTIPREKHEEVLGDILRPLGFSSDGSILVALTTSNEIVFCDVKTREVLRRIPLDGDRRGLRIRVAISADLKTLAQGLDGGEIKIWNLETGETRDENFSGDPSDVVALSTDGHVLIIGSRGRRLRTRDLRSGAEVELPFAASRIVLSPDGRTMAAFLQPERPPGEIASDLPFRRGSTTDAPDIPPPPPIMVGHQPTGSVVLWDLKTGTVRAQLAIDAGIPLDAAFSPDGRIFATAGTDNSIRLWGTGTGVLLGVCTGHKQIVRAIAFSPDGATLASTSDDSTLRFWNAASQQELLSFRELGSRMTAILFSPDNITLVIARTTRGENKSLVFRRAPFDTENR